MTMVSPLRNFRNGTADWKFHLWFCLFGLVLAFCAWQARAQEDPLNKVHVQPPSSSTKSPAEPAGAEPPPESGPAAMRAHPGPFIPLNTYLVLAPVPVTDPMNRLVTGLERTDFE